MTTQYVSYNSYYGHECRWGDSTSNTAVSIAPAIYRWDAYDVYASESFTEKLTEPNGSTGSWSYTKSVSTSGGYTFLDSFGTRTYSRKESAYTVKLVFSFSGGSSWSGSYHSVSSSATFTLTVPALQSYAVTFNANGGTGAPSSQTKYYGKALALSSTVPTRENYNFLGWATSSTATSAQYQSGASYTGNAALALYAVWELAVVPPTATVTAYRVGSLSSTTEQGDGEYVYAKCDWSQGDNAVTTVTGAYTVGGTSYPAIVSGATSGVSGTAQTWFALPTGDNASVAFAVADGQTSTSKSAAVSSVNFPIYVHDRDQVDIYELHAGTLYTGNLSAREGEVPGQTFSVSRVYTGNGFAVESGAGCAAGDIVTFQMCFTATTAFAGNGSTVAASIPSQYAPPFQLRIPLFTTPSWGDYIVGCAILASDGTIKFWSKSATVWFGYATYVRKPAGWTSS